VKVDLGCGNEKREGYVGVDLVKQDGVDIVCDIVKDGLPFMEGEVETISSSHFLEHIPNEDVVPFLKECRRVLQPGGLIEIVVPDLIWVLKTFLDLKESERWGFPLKTIFGQQTNDGEFHKNGFSRERLASAMTQAGFTVKVCMPVWTHNQQSLLARAIK